MKQHARQLQRTDFGRPVRSEHDMYVRTTRRTTNISAQAPAAPLQVRPPTPLSGRMTQFLRVIGVFTLLLALVGASLSTTLSYYQDIEISTGNTLATGGVDFVLEDTPFSNLASTTDWEVDVVPEDFSNPFFYVASSSNFSGNLALCAALTVTAYQNDVIMYQGPLSALRTATSTDLSTWIYDFDNFEEFAGQTCNFDIVYYGWQTRHDYNPGGYSDVEAVSYSITVPSMLLTKVYFDYDAGETCFDDTATTTIQNGSIRFQLINNDLPHCDEVSPTQEWVELYNLTTEPIDLTDWQICDGDACDELPAGHVIASGAFALLAERDTIHTEISIPWDVELILIPDGLIGNGLRTKGDMLQLRNPEGLLVDQLNWGEVNQAWPNNNPQLWPGDSLTASSGQALARLPIDVDTNQPTDWNPLGIPAVILLNPASTTVSITPGELVDITWIAHNLNGPDEDLKIDIYWFDPGDGLHLIVLDTPNDGLFQWQAPNNLSGNVRIKLVATGPENPLLNTRILTNNIPVSSTAFKSRAMTMVMDSDIESASSSGLETVKGQMIEDVVLEDKQSTTTSSGVDEQELDSEEEVYDSAATSSAKVPAELKESQEQLSEVSDTESDSHQEELTDDVASSTSASV